MKIYPYVNTMTQEPANPRAHLRIEYHLSQGELVSLLAANAPFFYDKGSIDWGSGEQAPDLPRAETYGLIVEYITTHGAGDLLWYEDVDPDEVEARKTWAARQVERHWGEAFRRVALDEDSA